MSSKYAQRMARLSSKIFGEYRRPEMPAHLSKDRIYSNEVRDAWIKMHYRNQVVINKMAQLPLDLDRQRTPDFYPPHPQHTFLMGKLRELGLFRWYISSSLVDNWLTFVGRDEHLDFKDEIDRQRVMRGKPVKHKRRSKKTIVD